MQKRLLIKFNIHYDKSLQKMGTEYTSLEKTLILGKIEVRRRGGSNRG